jgi:Flp pilus assembly protein TadD
METIGPPDTFHLSSAVGWIELGGPAEAVLELDKISPEHQSHPDVLEVRWALRAEERDWAGALEVAAQLVHLAPDRASGWLHQAYAARRAPDGGLEKAWQILLPAAERFPEENLIAYNLACYACQMRNLDDARAWLRQALGKGKKAQFKALALRDEDLALLWPEIQAM